MTPALVTLAVALAPHPSVSVRMARALIASGKLPATKIGRAYLVSPADLSRLLAPTLRAPVDVRRGDSPRAREDKQLRAAGFVPASH